MQAIRRPAPDLLHNAQKTTPTAAAARTHYTLPARAEGS